MMILGRKAWVAEIAAALPLLLAAPGWGQATAGTATVAGTVADGSGAVVPGAAVTLTNVARGSELRTSANEAGNYVFPDVVPGEYRLRVAKDGFETYEVTALHVAVGQRATVNITLRLGQITNVVTVAAEAVQLETTSNAIGTVVDSGRVNELPLNGRNFLQLALLAGGSNEAAGRADPAGQVGHPGRAVVVGGTKAATNGYMINGIQVRGARLGELAVNLSVANIDEFKVQQSFFMPDEGPNPSIVSVNTRSGTNSFHGQAFWFVRNKEFDARNFFAPGPEDLKRNQFGFAVGGPVIRDRMWFHGGYEGLRQITGFSSRAYTPTRAMFDGNFQELGSTLIHDPLTLNASAGTRTPFPNNVIPAGRINPVSRQLLRYYLPGSSLSERPSNLFANPRDTVDDDQFNLRLDATLTGRQSIFGQFIHSQSPAVSGGIFPLSGAFYPNQMHLGMAQHTYALTAALVNTLRAGVSRNVALFSNQGRDAGDLLTPLGIVNTFDVRGITAQGIQGYAGFGRANGDLGNLDNNYQLDEGVSWLKGNHQIRAGISIRYRRTWQQNANAGAHGNLNYQRTFTAELQRTAAGALVPRANTGDAFADFLLGMPTTGSARGLPMLPYRFTQYMPYFQDTWKVRRNLTLNYGISWFKDTIPDPQGRARDFMHGFDERTGLLQFAVLGEVDPKVMRSDNNNFTPRLGLAWQVNGKTVLRAGGGVYFSDQQLIELQFAAVGPPFNDSVDIINTGQLLPVYTLGNNIFPRIPLPAIDKDFARKLPAGTAPFLLNGDSKTPYVSQWNFSVQRMLTGADSIELAYLGNSGHRQQNRYDFNQCPVEEGLFCNRALRPYPLYTSLLRADFNGNSSYNAFITKYQHRLSGGIDLRAEYTFAKAMTDSWESGGSTNTQISTRRRWDKDLASFDTRHRMVLSGIWDIPAGKGRRYGAAMHPAAELLLGGWTLTAISTFQTGTPFIMAAPNTTGSPLVDHRPMRTCDGKLANPDIRADRRYLDPGCWSTPASGRFGNSSRNPLAGPGLNNWDLGIQKLFRLTEGVRLQFRTEMFNAFNHAQFGNPNANTGSGANFGLVGGARAPRLVQFGLKLIF